MQMTVNQKPEGRTWTFELSELEMIRYLADAITLVANDAKTDPVIALHSIIHAPDKVLANLAEENLVAKIFCAHLLEHRRLGISQSEKDFQEGLKELARIAKKRAGGK